MVPLNSEGGVMKGGIAAGDCSGLKLGRRISNSKLADGNIEVPNRICRVRLVSYPGNPHCRRPKLWADISLDLLLNMRSTGSIDRYCPLSSRCIA